MRMNNDDRWTRGSIKIHNDISGRLFYRSIVATIVQVACGLPKWQRVKKKNARMHTHTKMMCRGKKKHLQFNGAVRGVKATHFLCIFACSNFDLVSNAIKSDYEQRECALWINHFSSKHIRGLFDSVNWERARSASCFGDFEKLSIVEKMTNNGRFIMDVNYSLIHTQTHGGY